MGQILSKICHAQEILLFFIPFCDGNTVERCISEFNSYIYNTIYIVTFVRGSVNVSVISSHFFVTLFCHTSEFYHENSSRLLYIVIVFRRPRGARQSLRRGHFLVNISNFSEGQKVFYLGSSFITDTLKLLSLYRHQTMGLWASLQLYGGLSLPLYEFLSLITLKTKDSLSKIPYRVAQKKRTPLAW